MPNDRSALEFLAVAYEQSGDRVKRNRVVCTLGDVLIAEKDLEYAENLLQTLQDIGTSESFAAFPGTILGRGVLPLANLGDTLLVAMLNPADKLLRKQMSDKAGKPCQFCLAASPAPQADAPAPVLPSVDTQAVESVPPPDPAPADAPSSSITGPRLGIAGAFVLLLLLFCFAQRRR